jgi:hypothetical protein
MGVWGSQSFRALIGVVGLWESWHTLSAWRHPAIFYSSTVSSKQAECDPRLKKISAISPHRFSQAVILQGLENTEAFDSSEGPSLKWASKGVVILCVTSIESKLCYRGDRIPKPTCLALPCLLGTCWKRSLEVENFKSHHSQHKGLLKVVSKLVKEVNAFLWS